jgi:nitrogen regulatory protein P-II 1
MKKIECYVREADAYELLAGLSKSGINGVTASTVQGFGRQRGQEGEGKLIPKVKVEILALEVEVDTVLSTVMKFTRHGNYGDGKIAILELADAIRVRTGETGPKALM